MWNLKPRTPIWREDSELGNHHVQIPCSTLWAFKIRSMAFHGKLLAFPTPSTTHQNSLRRSISPSKSKDQHATSEQSIQTQPELLYQQSPNAMLLAATSYTRVLLIPCYLVPHILGITNAHMNVFGDEVLWAKFEEVSWKGIMTKLQLLHQ